MTRKKVQRWRQDLEVRMDDGSIVTLTADLTDADTVLTRRDIEAIKRCIEEISLRRMDPKRAQRRAEQALRDLPIQSPKGDQNA